MSGLRNWLGVLDEVRTAGVLRTACTALQYVSRLSLKRAARYCTFARVAMVCAGIETLIRTKQTIRPHDAADREFSNDCWKSTR